MDKIYEAKEFIEQWAFTFMTISCQLLEVGWAKVNVDGTVARQIPKVAIGGAMRGASGGWLVEARAVLEGLKLAWD
ncbi:hypothetical protein PVK06_001954 [Gossypium arboreum]|uniref:RNase H type-1 domain-containing protein n=1 Tax=Gossypium arboreum TaxID=29729 RepID=A0ABR0R2B5_GOSAR|nr:hypothetical protein PVK06_001954 [Gossypium arboreum]